MNSPATPPRVLVVVVNYRTADLTVECLRSAKDDIAALGNARVVVVDNASGDDSVNRIETAIADEGWSGWVQLRAAPKNGGFSYGNNFAMRTAFDSDDAPDYVLLLNPDTRVVGSALSTLVDFMQVRPHVGIAGARLEWPDGTPRYRRFVSPVSPAS